MTSEDARVAAARFYLEDEGVEADTYDEHRFAVGSREYLILTDEEATERAIEYIRDSAWAFQASFVRNYVPEGVTDEIIEMIGEKCEDGNAAMLALIGNRFDEFASDAIDSDGRGHFLAGYDGEEVEFEHGGTTWYAYRI